MIFHSDRMLIKKAYYEWLMENPDVKDCTENLIGFMAIEGLLKDRNECDFYDKNKEKRTLITVGSPMTDDAENKTYVVNRDMVEPIIRTNLLEEKPKTNEPLKRRVIDHEYN